MILKLRRETEGHFLLSAVILGFLSIFKTSQASSPFEALNSARLSGCQRDVRSPVQMRQGPRDFSRVCTGDSDSLSSSEMKDDPPFMPVHQNPAFLRVKASRGPLPLEAENTGSLSHTYC